MAEKRRPRRFKKYVVPGYLYDALAMLRPPEDILVSEWAEQNRRLDSKTSAIPGPWRNSMTPYLVGIMDELCDYETQEIVFCKPTQIGGTEVLLNIIGYVITQDPSPAMIVYPTQELAESISDNRLQPMIRLCPKLQARWQESVSKKLELQFEGMYLSLVGSNSPSGLASRACKYLALDEVDKYPEAAGREADPVKLARERQKTFRTSRKMIITSTPTLATGHIWQALQAADEERHYFVPCPHCGEYIELRWSQIRYPGKHVDSLHTPGGSELSDTDPSADDEAEPVELTASERADQAVYVCQCCRGVIQDYHKDSMLRAGRWQTVRQTNPVHRTVGFWINTLYSPFVRFSDVALEFMRSKDNPAELQNFVNSWLAEPWEDTHLKTSAKLVLDRRTGLGNYEVPEWCRMLTGGVDVQENCIYWTIRAWGEHMTSQNIAHGQSDGWADVEHVMNLAYPLPSGEQMVVALCLIDSGYNADLVYDFCADHSEWALPVKGSSTPQNSAFKFSVINRPGSRASGMNLVIVDGGQYKDMIAARLLKARGPGSWLVNRDCDDEYANQVTAEHKINVRVGARTVQRWALKHTHADNHYLDCEVYAMAAADIRGIRYLHLETADALDQAAKAQPTPRPPEERWLSEHEQDNWWG